MNTQLKITQIRSPIGRNKKQRATLIGLGLNKIGRSTVVELSPQMEGMVNAVGHLLNIEKITK